MVGPEEGAVGSAAESWQHLICSVSVSVYLNPWDPFNRLMWFHVTQIFNNQNNGLQYTECRSRYENLVAFHQISTNNARENLRQWHWFPTNCAIYLLNELIKYWKNVLVPSANTDMLHMQKRLFCVLCSFWDEEILRLKKFENRRLTLKQSTISNGQSVAELWSMAMGAPYLETPGFEPWPPGSSLACSIF